MNHMQFTWRLGRPYLYGPWHNGLPTFRDWLKLLFGLLVLAFAFKKYIIIGEHYGWKVGLGAFAEALKEIKESWLG